MRSTGSTMRRRRSASRLPSAFLAYIIGSLSQALTDMLVRFHELAGKERFPLRDPFRDIDLAERRPGTLMGRQARAEPLSSSARESLIDRVREVMEAVREKLGEKSENWWYQHAPKAGGLFKLTDYLVDQGYALPSHLREVRGPGEAPRDIAREDQEYKARTQHDVLCSRNADPECRRECGRRLDHGWAVGRGVARTRVASRIPASHRQGAGLVRNDRQDLR
jgi:hypothetical protein